jgi:hypothetical protein
VPRPPSFAQLPALRRARTTAASDFEAVLKASANSIHKEIDSFVVSEDDTVTASGAKPVDVCPAPGARVFAPFGTPRTDGQAKVFMQRTLTWPPAAGCNRPDGTPYPSPFDGGAATVTFLGSCSGNTISDGLVLFAAHCMSPTDTREEVLGLLRRNSGYPAGADPCNIGTTYSYVLNNIAVRSMTSQCGRGQQRSSRTMATNGWWQTSMSCNDLQCQGVVTFLLAIVTALITAHSSLFQQRK